MKDTDKIKIESMLTAIHDLTKLTSKENAKFVDKNVAEFIVSACEDYKGNKEEIISILKKDANTFFSDQFLPINHLKYNNPFGVTKEWVQLGYNTGFFVNMTIRWGSVLNPTGGYIIHDVRFYTSNTDDNRYRICSGYDFLENQNNDVVREVRDAEAIATPHTAEWWKKAYEIAVNTKRKNECMVAAFTTFLEYVAACIGHDAEKAQDAKAFLKTKVEVYTKVKI